MMMTKIVADSSADLLTLGDLPFASVPLTIHAGDRVFVDDEHCDIDGMIAFLRTYKGKTTTSCPNTECWLKAFGNADTVRHDFQRHVWHLQRGDAGGEGIHGAASGAPGACV